MELQFAAAAFDLLAGSPARKVDFEASFDRELLPAGFCRSLLAEGLHPAWEREPCFGQLKRDFFEGLPRSGEAPVESHLRQLLLQLAAGKSVAFERARLNLSAANMGEARREVGEMFEVARRQLSEAEASLGALLDVWERQRPARSSRPPTDCPRWNERMPHLSGLSRSEWCGPQPAPRDSQFVNDLWWRRESCERLLDRFCKADLVDAVFWHRDVAAVLRTLEHLGGATPPGYPSFVAALTLFADRQGEGDTYPTVLSC